jgi:uncharacterized protein YecE (DUF72 family)
VYPPDAPAHTWLSLYARRFATVELNNTFYRLPTASTVEGWAERVPPGFCFAVKVGQFGSHRKKLRDASRWLPRHLERITKLGPHLGPHLVQLPPRWNRDIARLDEFLALAPPEHRWAVELRDPTWVHDGVFEVLAQHHAALCLHDLLAELPWERTTSWTYVRFHGPRARSEPYRGAYGAERLAPIADRLATWLDDGSDVYAYFTTTTTATQSPTPNGSTSG